MECIKNNLQIELEKEGWYQWALTYQEKKRVMEFILQKMNWAFARGEEQGKSAPGWDSDY